ncbi:hypothetical protein [Powai lake megavirus]|uniref:Uncharacterized protein n=1 Tax=Powai lake megavirus TaxID=1842663 RepID=A0A160ER44_9VIRU|nr:hypothetical protein QJ849_gp987 [Powai lake megavirus]ANB51149.1 hypothetical protein [Powai lake megavirus]
MNQLKTTINDSEINGEEIFDENDSDQIFTEDQCLMDAFNHLCNIDKEMIKVTESRNNLFTPIPIKHKYIGVEYEYEHPSIYNYIHKCSKLEFNSDFSDLFNSLDSISNMVYGQQLNKSIEDID